MATPLARTAFLILAACLCNALSGLTLQAMPDSRPWWLRHAASLTIRAYSVDLVNRSDVLPDRHRLVAHLVVLGIGWVLGDLFLKFH